MSVEQMVKKASVDVEAATKALREKLERQNTYIQSQVSELTRIHDALVASEDDDEVEELEEEASELAEELEIEFIYTRPDGTRRVYSPRAFWEPSGGCEWVESAQYGYDYGWNI